MTPCGEPVLPAHRAAALTPIDLCGRLPPMQPPAPFQSQIGAVLRRYFEQNAQPAPSAATMADFTARLWALVVERGLPRRLESAEQGSPREIAEAEMVPLVARVVEPGADPLLSEAARQLIKACLYPEFRLCRESYVAVSPDGNCRRQELSRARKRISGSHCVDCPHWQDLEPGAHEAFLAAPWRGGADAFKAHRDVFLPEDYRVLRRWIRAQAS